MTRLNIYFIFLFATSWTTMNNVVYEDIAVGAEVVAAIWAAVTTQRAHAF